jgi:hypothetical protein
MAYILIGDDGIGKTRFQKWLIWHLCGKDTFTKLLTNTLHDVTHRDAPRKFKTLSTINRSIQEKMSEYGSVDIYFQQYFQEANVAILSSHAQPTCIPEITRMIEQLNDRYYNVCAVFLTNHLNANTQVISNLKWHERILLQNPYNEENWEQQIDRAAQVFAGMLLKKAELY